MPKHVALMAGDDEAAHLRAVGHRVVSDEGEPVQLEGTDDFVTRMQVATCPASYILHHTGLDDVL